jgi:hypothetical protein
MSDPEKTSLGPNRIIGNNREAVNDAREFFDELHTGVEVIVGEREKTPLEERTINAVVEAVARALNAVGYGAKLFPPSRVHLLDSGGLPLQTHQEENTRRVGTTDTTSQDIILATQKDNVNELAHTLVHELLHIHSFSSAVALQTQIDGNPHTAITERRMGFTFTKHERKNAQSLPYHYLNEALTEQLAINILEGYFPQFDRLAHIEIDPEESYLDERICFEKLIDTLHAAHTELYPNRETIVDLFLDGMFKGNVLEIARLIEKTFGKGSFRELGERFSVQPVEIDDILKRAQIT